MTRIWFLTCLLGLLACSGTMMPAAEDGGGGGDSDGGVALDMTTEKDGAMMMTSPKGLQGFCEHYKACGGTFYRDAAACVKATLDYWKECRRAELDAFGSCMVAKVACGSWNPDAYNPANTPCATEWAAVRAKMCN